MKILKLVLIYICLALLLTGCGKKISKSVTLNENSLNTHFAYQYFNFNYSGEISFQGESCSFIISEPEELKGYSISVSKNSVSVMYEDVLIQYPDSVFCVKFPFKQVFDAITLLKTVSLTEAENSTYKFSSNDFTAVADENGALKELIFSNSTLKLK